MDANCNVRRVVLATGGIDSTVLLYRECAGKTAEQLKDVAVVTVDYGHVAAKKSIELLTEHCHLLGLGAPVVLPVVFRTEQCQPGLFQLGYVPTEANPLGNFDQLRYAEYFIQGRNAIMVLTAMAWCAENNFDELLAGYILCAEEWEKIWTYRLSRQDNTPAFVDAINLLAQCGFTRPVRFRAPYLEQRMDKKAVVALGRELRVSLKQTYSCYFIPACGVCDNCLHRIEELHPEEV